MTKPDNKMIGSGTPSLFMTFVWASPVNRKRFFTALCAAAATVLILIPVMKFCGAKSLKNKVVTINCWKAARSNFVYSFIKEEKKTVGGQSVALLAKNPPPEGYYFALYRFAVKKPGRYNVFWAGSPPGPDEKGSEWFVPFELSFDGKAPERFTEERTKKAYPDHPFTEYVPGAYFVTKLTTVELGEGAHTVELTLRGRRKVDDAYFLIADSIFLVKEGYRPPLKYFKKFPGRYFQ